MVESIEREDVVGEVYNDSWDEIRVSLDFWESQRTLSLEELNNILERRSLETKESGYSGECLQIVNKIEKHICSECESSALFDSKQMEFYCPVCEIE